MDGVSIKHAARLQAAQSPKKLQFSVQSPKSDEEATVTASGHFTAGSGTAGSKDEFKAHSASRPNQPHASGNQRATKNGAKC